MTENIYQLTLVWVISIGLDHLGGFSVDIAWAYTFTISQAGAVLSSVLSQCQLSARVMTGMLAWAYSHDGGHSFHKNNKVKQITKHNHFSSPSLCHIYCCLIVQSKLHDFKLSVDGLQLFQEYGQRQCEQPSSYKQIRSLHCIS